MMEYNFWEVWKRKTGIERRAISAVKKARNLVMKSVPKNELVAIYVKGSFARREMMKGSDVDMVPIVTENKYEGNVFAVNDSKIEPAVVVPLSLWELKYNKLYTKPNNYPDLRARPDRFLKKLNEYKLIYGKSLNPKKFPIREDKEALREEINKIKKGYIPAYKRRKIGFKTLLKEVFWFVELEQNVKGKKVKHSFEGIAQSVKDKDHLIHEALNLRKTKIKDKKIIIKFIKKLEKYLDKV